MYNSYITTSSITTFRTRNVYPYSYNHDYYSNCSSDRYSFAVSSQRTSCCCFSSCSSSVYRVPASASYCYDLYNGCSRQSSLIQCRRLCYGGYYSRLPVCEVDRRHCCCDKSVKEKRVSEKKRGLKKCMVIERRSESYDDVGDNNEVESILSLLTDDVGEECFRVRRESKRLVKKPLVERKENGGVNNRYESKKKRNDSGYLENEARLEYELGESSSRKRDDRRGGRFEKENRKASKVGDSREALRVSQREEDIEQEKSLLRLRKESSDAREQVRIRTKEEEKKESLLRSRKEDLNERERVRIRANEEEKEESLRREEHRNRMRKDGSSCSSYYSVDSTGDYESDEEIELKAGGTAENSSVRHENVVRNETGYQKRDDYREDLGVNLTKKESNARSSVIESDFRKKSEKKLLDSSVEEVVSRKETVQKEAEISMARGSGYGKSSLKNEDRKVTSTGISSLDFQRQQIYAQEISRQSESRTESKQFKGNQDINSGSAETSYGSQKIKSSKDEISSKAAKSSQTAVRLSKGEDEIQRKSQNATVMSDTIDVDIRKLSISLQEFETNVKRRNDYSSNTDSSAYDSEKKHNEVSELVEPKRKSEQLRKGESNSSLMIQSDNQLIKQGDNVELLYGSSMLSEKQPSRSHAYFTRRDDNKYQSDEVNNISIGQSGDSSGIVIKDDYKSESGITSAPSSSHFASHEDAVGSAARFQESSKHYIGELADDVRHEMLSSETQIEKETRETQLKVGTSSIQNTSVDSESKEHESSRISQGSGSKGPSAEMWKVDETSTGNQSNPESLEDPNKNNDVIVKRNGRSMWNIIGDVLRLRWSPRSESQSTSGKTGGRSSPNQSTGSETFFSGHEAEEIEEVAGKKESKIKIEELASDTQEEDKTKKSPSSSTLVGHLKPVGINAPSSSVAIDSGSSSTGFQLPFTGEFSRSNFGGTSVASASKLRRSPVVRSVSEGEEASISETGINEQLTSGVEQSGLARDDGEQKERRMLQRKDQIVKDQFDEWEDAYRFDAEQRKVDEMFMREALLEAKKAGDNWEVPVGAVLVHNGKIIARGYNLVEELRDSTAHAEMICIREGSNLLRTWRLSETTLYVTLEPCPMCAGAILQARVDTVVWGAPNKLLGADGSWIRLFPNGGSGSELEQQSDKPAAPVHPFHPKIIIRRGVLSSECAETMQQFFQLRRRRKDKKPQESTSSPSTSSRLSISQHPSKILKKMHQAFHIMFCL